MKTPNVESPEELAEWAKRKKQQQHDAYRRWYTSPKGQEYQAKRRAKLKLERMNGYVEADKK